ncbi:hypothetical protein BKA93DRAFT_343769 [Sparassis latifolia]
MDHNSIESKSGGGGANSEQTIVFPAVHPRSTHPHITPVDRQHQSRLASDDSSLSISLYGYNDQYLAKESSNCTPTLDPNDAQPETIFSSDNLCSSVALQGSNAAELKVEESNLVTYPDLQGFDAQAPLYEPRLAQVPPYVPQSSRYPHYSSTVHESKPELDRVDRCSRWGTTSLPPTAGRYTGEWGPMEASPPFYQSATPSQFEHATLPASSGHLHGDNYQSLPEVGSSSSLHNPHLPFPQARTNTYPSALSSPMHPVHYTQPHASDAYGGASQLPYHPRYANHAHGAQPYPHDHYRNGTYALVSEKPPVTYEHPEPPPRDYFCQWVTDNRGTVCNILLDDVTPSGITRHLREHHFPSSEWNKSYRGICRWGGCTRSEMDYASFGKHIASVHLRGAVLWECEYCTRDFSRRDAMKRHLKTCPRSPTSEKNAGPSRRAGRHSSSLSP